MGHLQPIQSIAISPDGKYIVSGSSDAFIKIWNLSERMEERTLTGHTKTILSVAISPDGEHIVSSSRDSFVKI